MSPAEWLHKIADLNVYRARHGVAPHKPLLLLVLCDLADEGLLPGLQIDLTPQLAFRFFSYWTIVAHRRTQRADVRFPFYHLSGDGLWTPLDTAGRPASEPRRAGRARFDPTFRASLGDRQFRDTARRLLIEGYFPQDEQISLYALLGWELPDDFGEAHENLLPEPAEERGRQVRFRLTVVARYDYTCALTGCCLTTIDGATIVDAAHIHDFADSRNNEPANGLALCKNAHWLFDNGLWSLSDNFEVLVARDFFEERPSDYPLLTQYEGRRIRLPKNEAHWPGRGFVGWHRENVFLGSAAL